MSVQTQELGSVPLNRGEYSASESYYENNLVQYNNCTYICIVEGPITNIDPETTSSWSLFAGIPLEQTTGSATDRGLSQAAIAENYLNKQQVVQELGDSEENVISQKEITNISFETNNKGITIIGDLSTNLKNSLKNFINIVYSGSLSEYRLANIWYSESVNSRKITLYDSDDNETIIRFAAGSYIGKDEAGLGIQIIYNWDNHTVADNNYLVANYENSPVQFNDYGDKGILAFQTIIADEKENTLLKVDKKILEKKGITATNESALSAHTGPLSRLIKIETEESLSEYKLATIYKNAAGTLFRIVLKNEEEAEIIVDFNSGTFVASDSNKRVKIIYDWTDFDNSDSFILTYANSTFLINDNTIVESITEASDISNLQTSVSALQTSVSDTTTTLGNKQDKYLDWLYNDDTKYTTYKELLYAIKGIYVDKIPDGDSLILYKFLNRNIAFALGSDRTRYIANAVSTDMPNFIHLTNSSVSIYMYVDWDNMPTGYSSIRIPLSDRIFSLSGQEILKPFISECLEVQSNDENLLELDYTTSSLKLDSSRFSITNTGTSTAKIYNVSKGELLIISNASVSPYRTCFTKRISEEESYIQLLNTYSKEYFIPKEDGYIVTIDTGTTVNKLVPITSTTSPLYGKTIALFGDSIGQLMAGDKSTYANSYSFVDTDGTTYTRSEVSLVNGITYVTSSLDSGSVTDDSIRVEVVNSGQSDIDSMGWDELQTKLGAKQIVNCSFGSGRIVEKGWQTEYPAVNAIDEDGQEDAWDGLSASLPNAVKMLKRLYTAGNCDAPDCCIIWMGVNGADQVITDTLEEAMQIEYSTLANDYEGYNYRKKFYAALRYAIETLYRNFPYTNIFLVSPAQTSRGDLNIAGTKATYRGYQSLSAVGTAMKEISDRYSCTFVDATHTMSLANFAYKADTDGSNQTASGENLGNLIPLFLSDGLHPNIRGKVLWKNFIASKLNTLYFDKK